MATQKFKEVKNVVSFQDALKMIQPGDLFFTSGKYNASSAIKAITDSDVSHVGVIGFIYDRAVVFESASGDGVRVVPLAHYLFNYENSKKAYNGKIYFGRHKKFPKDAVTQKIFFQVAVDLLNYNYDDAEGKKILLDRLLHIGSKSENDAYICSEYIERLFFSINLPFAVAQKGFVFPEHVAADPDVEILAEIIQ